MNKNNIIPRLNKITRKDRERLHKNKGHVLWFTGLSGSGKSTIADRVEEILNKNGVSTFILDGDNIRSRLNSDLDFSESGRKENIRRIGEVAALFKEAGILTLVCFISPFRDDRENAGSIIGKNDLSEVYVKCSLEKCEKRDVKGLYKKARDGKIKEFTGLDSPYEEPESPDIILNTETDDIEVNIKTILEYLKDKKII